MICGWLTIVHLNAALPLCSLPFFSPPTGAVPQPRPRRAAQGVLARVHGAAAAQGLDGRASVVLGGAASELYSALRCSHFLDSCTTLATADLPRAFPLPPASFSPAPNGKHGLLYLQWRRAGGRGECGVGMWACGRKDRVLVLRFESNAGVFLARPHQRTPDFHHPHPPHPS